MRTMTGTDRDAYEPGLVVKLEGKRKANLTCGFPCGKWRWDIGRWRGACLNRRPKPACLFGWFCKRRDCVETQWCVFPTDSEASNTRSRLVFLRRSNSWTPRTCPATSMSLCSASTAAAHVAAGYCSTESWNSPSHMIESHARRKSRATWSTHW